MNEGNFFYRCFVVETSTESVFLKNPKQNPEEVEGELWKSLSSSWFPSLEPREDWTAGRHLLAVQQQARDHVPAPPAPPEISGCMVWWEKVNGQ